MVALVQITKAKPRSRVTISTPGAAIHHICIEFTLLSEHYGDVQETVAEPTMLGSVRLEWNEDDDEKYFPTVSNVSPAPNFPKALVECALRAIVVLYIHIRHTT